MPNRREFFKGPAGVPIFRKRQPYFLAGIAILETVIVSPFMSPVNV
jgi:hypothetical protein